MPTARRSIGAWGGQTVSLSIEVNKVTDVLLADKWHKINDGSFDIDAYEFINGTETVHKGGNGGITSAGFVFESEGVTFSGPLTSVLAVRYQ